MPNDLTDTVEASLARLREAREKAASRSAEHNALLAEARHVEKGLLSLIRQSLDAGQLDADDAVAMLPIVRKTIEGNHG